MRTVKSHLRYYERSNGEFRDLRSIEQNFKVRGNRKFTRISLNGQYRVSKTRHNETRMWNPGWTFGTENFHINWTHFRRHCWHLSFNAAKRGITFSYGRAV